MIRLTGLTLTIVCCCVLFLQCVVAQVERSMAFSSQHQPDNSPHAFPEKRHASANEPESFSTQGGGYPVGLLLFISLQVLIIIALWRNIIRRKQAEKDLLLSEERFNQAMRATQDGLFDWNLKTDEIYYSPGWKRMLGYTIDELGNDLSVWEQLTDPVDVKKSFHMLQEHIDGKRDRFEMEFKMRHKDGHWVDIFSRANAVFDREGNASRVVGTHVDITARKQAQKALSESEKLLSAVFNSTSDLQMVVHVGSDETLRVHALNQAYAETTMRSGVQNVQEQLVGKTLEEAAVVLGQDPQDLNEAILRYRQAIESGEAVTYIESTTVVNQSLHAEITLSPILDDRNQCHYVLYNSHNVTEAQNALNALQESETRFRELFDTISSGVAVYQVEHDGQYGKDYIIRNFNKTSLQLEGMEKKDVVGKSLFDLRPNIDSYGLIPIFREVWRTGEPGFFPAKIYVDDRYANYYENRIFRLPDGEIVAVYDDVTERKRGEEALQQLNSQLEERVRKRTERLEEANKALNDFAYIVSHDLKAPLRGIARLSEWIVQDYGHTLDADGKKMTGLLKEQVLRMDRLINGILRYSRAGRQLEKIEAIELAGVLEPIIDSIIPSDRIEVSFAQDLPSVFGDAVRLEQVFQNLLSNAVKFMDKAEGKIVISSEEREEYWIFSVADNGPGIEATHYARIFQIFQTLLPDEEQQNTGIGLALVKKIVELHGGRIWVESHVGSGSTFYFTLSKDLSQAMSQDVFIMSPET